MNQMLRPADADRPPGGEAAWGAFRCAWPAVLAGAAAAGGCWAAAGAGLGMFFGGIALATILIPPLSLARRRPLEQLFVAGGLIDGIALAWLAGIFIAAPPVGLLQWLGCYALLAAWGLALWGIARAMERLLGQPILASATATVLALLWLSGPVWLAPHLAGARGRMVAGWLAAVHPLLACNGVLSQLGVWSERPIAYRYLLNLGQDIPYELRHTILPAVVVYLLVGAATLGAASGGRS